MFQENRVKPNFSPNGPFQSRDLLNHALTVRRSCWKQAPQEPLSNSLSIGIILPLATPAGKRWTDIVVLS